MTDKTPQAGAAQDGGFDARRVRAADGRPFPRMDARSLTGDTLRLPADLGAAPSAVLVGFEIRHQATMDSWLPTLDVLATRYPGLRVYELVPIPRFLAPARPTIDGGMASGIASPEVRARTLTAYVDLPPLLAALGLPDIGQSALFLVAPDGSIGWGTRGGHDAAGEASLGRALAGLPVDRAGGRRGDARGGRPWPT